MRQPPLRRDQRPLGPLAERGGDHRRAQRRRVGDQKVHPRRQSSLGVGQQKALEERRVGLLAEPGRRDQHQRQRLHAQRLGERRRHRAAERMADEMGFNRALLDHGGARGFDERLETRLLAERGEPVSGQIDRERGPRPGQEPA